MNRQERDLNLRPTEYRNGARPTEPSCPMLVISQNCQCLWSHKHYKWRMARKHAQFYDTPWDTSLQCAVASCGVTQFVPLQCVARATCCVGIYNTTCHWTVGSMYIFSITGNSCLIFNKGSFGSLLIKCTNCETDSWRTMQFENGPIRSYSIQFLSDTLSQYYSLR